MIAGRSREGAWIEIKNFEAEAAGKTSRSREGAWIEIAKAAQKQADTAQSLP